MDIDRQFRRTEPYREVLSCFPSSSKHWPLLPGHNLAILSLVHRGKLELQCLSYYFTRRRAYESGGCGSARISKVMDDRVTAGTATIYGLHTQGLVRQGGVEPPKKQFLRLVCIPIPSSPLYLLYYLPVSPGCQACCLPEPLGRNLGFLSCSLVQGDGIKPSTCHL